MFQKRCHSSNHRRDGSRKEVRFQNEHSHFVEESEPQEKETDDGEFDIANDLEPAAGYVAFVRATVAMGVNPRDTSMVVDAALVDTGSAVLSTIGEQLVQAARVASSRSTRPEFGKNIRTIGTMCFFFHIGCRKYKINLYMKLPLRGEFYVAAGLTYSQAPLITFTPMLFPISAPKFSSRTQQRWESSLRLHQQKVEIELESLREVTLSSSPFMESSR